jgi:hypothetical protein
MSGGESGEDFSVAVHQAAGMIAVQADCEIVEALNRLKIRAEAAGQTLHETALEVLDRVIRFDRLT